MLSPIKKVDSASGIVSPNLSPFAQILNIFQKKKEGEMTRFTDEGKEDSARQNLTENRAKEFERKKLDFNNRFAIEEELPHFGTKEEKLKSQIINTQPDLFMNKSFHVNLENRIQTQPNFEQEMKIEKSIIEDKSVLVDQTVNSCLICFDKTPNAVFMDCGHGGFLI